MAGDAQAADGAAPQVDIIGHILNHDYLELPFVDPDHLLAGKVELPQFPPINVGGVEIDLSITRHVVVMWVANAILIGLLLSAFRKAAVIDRI